MHLAKALHPNITSTTAYCTLYLQAKENPRRTPLACFSRPTKVVDLPTNVDPLGSAQVALHARALSTARLRVCVRRAIARQR